jgi:hypothetical protein
MASSDVVVDLKADNTFGRIAYIVRTGTPAFDLYYADIGTPASAQPMGQIPSDVVTPPPTIDALRTTGDAALIHTLQLVPSSSPSRYYENLAEFELPGGPMPIQFGGRLRGSNVYTYVDDFNSVAFTSDDGVKVAARNSLNTPKVVLAGPTAFFEFSADSQLVAGITAPFPARALVVASRGGGAIQLTALRDQTSQTLSLRVVPAN